MVYENLILWFVRIILGCLVFLFVVFVILLGQDS
jgi:hypothetical protein